MIPPRVSAAKKSTDQLASEKPRKTQSFCVQKPVTMNIDGQRTASQLTVISSKVGSPKPHSMACCGACCIQLWLIAVASPPSADSVTSAPHRRCPRGMSAPRAAKAPTSMYMKRWKLHM